jgi:hypothetical protein
MTDFQRAPYGLPFLDEETGAPNYFLNGCPSLVQNAPIRICGDLSTAIIFHRRDTEDAEDIFLFAHRDQPSLKPWHGRDGNGQKTCTFGDNSTTYLNQDIPNTSALMLIVCRLLPANEKNTSLRSLCLCGEIKLSLGHQNWLS